MKPLIIHSMRCLVSTSITVKSICVIWSHDVTDTSYYCIQLGSGYRTWGLMFEPNFSHMWSHDCRTEFYYSPVINSLIKVKKANKSPQFWFIRGFESNMTTSISTWYESNQPHIPETNISSTDRAGQLKLLQQIARQQPETHGSLSALPKMLW